MKEFENEEMYLDEDAEAAAEAALTEEDDSEEAVAEAENFDVRTVRLSTDDPLKLFMADIAQFPRLTKEEEIELGKRKDAGDIEARDRLVQCNLRLVVALAKKKYDAISCVSSIHTTLEDLIQEGCMGLVTAADKFDWTKGCKFSTSAVYWINHAIMDGIDQNARTIRLPSHKIEEITTIKKASSELYRVLNRDPLTSELAVFLNFKFTEEHINDLLGIISGSAVVSLSTPLGDSEEDGEVADMIPDSAETPEEYTMRVRLDESIHNALRMLPDREQLVVAYSFGLEDCDKKTLDEIADMLYNRGYTNKNGGKITREGVRLIKERALQQMKPYIEY